MMPEPRLAPRPAPRPLHWPPIVHRLQAVLGSAAAEVYLVGGVVRDAFWGIPAHDIDLAVPHDAFGIARQIANALDGAFYKLDPERQTGRAIIEADGRRWVIDVAVFRGGDLLDDLTGRDFTLNAAAAPLAGDLSTVIDPLDGLSAAAQRLLQRCSPESIPSDPIRALRAVRQAARFKLRIEPATLADIKRHGPRLVETSPERVRDEFMALLSGARPAAALRTLDALKLLPLLLPEADALRGIRQSAPHQFDVWQHTLETVRRLDQVLQTISPKRNDNTAAQAGLGMIVYFLDRFRGQLQEHITQTWPQDRPHKALLTLAALLHDSGKPQTQSVDGDRIRFLGHEQPGAAYAEARGRALRLSNAEITRLVTVIRHHMRPHLLANEPSVSRRAVYRFWRDCGPAGVDVCLLAMADYLATVDLTLDTKAWTHYLQTIGALLDGYYDQAQTVVDLPALISGSQLMKHLKLQPGPQVGQLLEAIREAQAAGEIHTAADALQLARELHQG